MEPSKTEKKTKTIPKKQVFAALRIRKELKRQIEIELDNANKKDFGRKIKAEEYLALAISLMTPSQLLTLREASLTNADRLERDYRKYLTDNGPISRDEYLGKILNGEISSKNSTAAQPNTNLKTTGSIACEAQGVRV